MTVVTSLFIFPGASVLSSVRQKLGGVLLLRVEGGEGTDGMLQWIFFERSFNCPSVAAEKNRAVKATDAVVITLSDFLKQKKKI